MTTKTANSKAHRAEQIELVMSKVFDTFDSLVAAGDVKNLLPGMKDILTQAFVANLYKSKFRLLSKAPSYQGWRKRDGSTCEESAAQSMTNVVGQQLRWHTSGGYLGTIINANCNAGSMCEAFGFIGESPYRLERDGKHSKQYIAEYRSERDKTLRHFRDNVETFVMIVLLTTGGKSRALNRWQKALGI